MHLMTQQEISIRAYFIWQNTGCEDAVKNWKQAEADLEALYPKDNHALTNSGENVLAWMYNWDIFFTEIKLLSERGKNG